ncbi:hypothetical protein C5167_043573 [Papaver somniferum]|uniref:Uncharacterized protein n=1 Tax=Papaver somniferum TaxID=3469 RepID=A0A4Y7L640_PAPSO|nr:hypothetical protein C5167_043573 [Papaver somniferum]
MVWDIAVSLMENMGIRSSNISSSNEASFFSAAGWAQCHVSVNAEVYGWKEQVT